jgi:ATP-dependent DNA ligase
VSAAARNPSNFGSTYRSGRSAQWVKLKNPAAPAVRREAEEEWGR